MELFEIEPVGRGRKAADWGTLIRKAASEQIILPAVKTKPATKTLDSVRAMATAAKVDVTVKAMNEKSDGSGLWHMVLSPAK